MPYAEGLSLSFLFPCASWRTLAYSGWSYGAHMCEQPFQYQNKGDNA